MMKNLFFAATIAALTCAGCAKEDDPVIPGLDSCPVDFSTSIVEITRSEPVGGVEFASGKSVAVFGIEKKAGATDSNTAWMSNVELINNSGTWSYTGEKTFMKGYTYQFYAYAPFKATPLIMTTPTAVSYSVPTAIANQEDFMYAAVSKDFSTKGPAADETVALKFNHALSQVKFKAQTGKDYSAYYAVKIKSIKLNGLITTGALNFGDGTWNLNDASPVTSDYELSIDDQTLSANEALLTSGKDVLMLIPQNPKGKTLELTLEVTAVADKGDANVASGLKTITVSFPSDDTAWEAGHAYTYAITLNLDSALGWQVAGFSKPQITDWVTDPDRPIK